MKIVAWNLGHQTKERPIKNTFIDAVSNINPDVLVLNEYVHGESRQNMLKELAGLGLNHCQISTRLNENNQILIASKRPLVKGKLTGPESKYQGGESNFLHVSFEETDIEIVGIRAPAYSSTDLKTYWNNLIKIIEDTKKRNIIFIGDFNTDPDSTSRPTAKYLQKLRLEGWKIPTPLGDWSYISPKGIGTRIDHVIASPSIAISSAEYITAVDGIDCASCNQLTRISDHAALFVNLVLT